MNSRCLYRFRVSAILVVLLVACSGPASPQDMSGPISTALPAEETAAPTQVREEPAPIPSPMVPTEEPTLEPTPTATTVLVRDPCSAEDAAWIGTFGFGLNCLDASGWHTYTEDNSPIGNQIMDLAVCPDNRTWIAHTRGLSVTDGETWNSFEHAWGFGSLAALACDGLDGIWLAHFEGVTHYDGADWSTYPADQLGSGQNVNLVKDVAMAPDGRVWVGTANSVAVLADDTWKVYEKGKGFDKEYFFERIAVGSDGAVWAAHSGGLLKFTGKKWAPHEDKNLSQVQSLVIDAGNRLWAGTYAKGVSRKVDKGWKIHNRKNGGLTSNHVKAMDVDDKGRLWLGTEWGLNVLAGKAWSAFHMHSSDLADNEIYAVAVSGNGPALPALAEKAPGSLTGSIVQGAEPLAGRKVEACVETIGMMFSGPSPCAGMAFHRSATTGGDGAFAFHDLPAGRYGIAFQGDEGKWMRLTGAFGIGDKKVLVAEGEETALGEIDISD